MVPGFPVGFEPALVAIDVDGTLVDHTGSVSERLLESIARTQAAGVLVTLATGRSPSTTIPVARAAGISDLVVCSNGALLVSVEDETTVEAVTFDPRPVLEELIVHLPDAVYAVEDVDGIFRSTRSFGAGQLGLSMREVPFDHLLTRPVVRLVVQSEAHTSAGFREIVEALGHEAVVFGVSDVAWMDLAGKDVNKATMLERLCRHRGIDPVRTIAIGDFWNDVQMIEWAGWGVAMGGASDRFKEHADAVTGAEPGEGVADVLDAILG